MNTLYQKFASGLRWNIVESLAYQAILLGHQLLLFKTVPTNIYGLIGTIFSLIYLTITVTNLGLDTTLGSFFTQCLKSKQSFKQLIIPQLLPEAIAFSLLMSIWTMRPHALPTKVVTFIPSSLVIIIGCLIICESIKKTLRVILHLAFLNRTVAIIEITTIATYVASIWTIYFFGTPITLHQIFVPMLITSLAACCILSYYLYQFYATLPDDQTRPTPSFGLIMRNRFFNYGTELSHLFFSSNFLIPFVAVAGGLAQAGMFKLISTLSYSITTIMRKIFGFTSDAMFAHTKELALEDKRAVFGAITSKLYQVLYGITIFFVINHKKIFMSSALAQHDGRWILAILFIALQLSEHFFITYEKFFITHDRSSDLFICTGVTTLVLYCTLINTHHTAPWIVLSALLAIRILSFTCMGLVSFYRWQLQPSWKLHSTTIFYSGIISGIFFFLAK